MRWFWDTIICSKRARDVEFVAFEGLLNQEYYHDYPPRDPNGTNVITLDVFDPEDNLNYETYYLISKGAQFYRCARAQYGYPPDKQEKATETIIEQAETLSEIWAEEQP